jgi:hypothetical protein
LNDFFYTLRGRKPPTRYEKAKLPELSESRLSFAPFQVQEKTLNYIGNYKNRNEVVLLKNDWDRESYYKKMLTQTG